MAKPIEATPELTGEDARRFLENMIKKNNSEPDENDRRLAREIEKFSRNVQVA